MSCTTCNKDLDDCGCGSNGIHISPPSECNTPTCPDPEPCSEVIPTTCIVNTEDTDTLCGLDIVYVAGDTLAEIHSKIVEYFCTKVTDLEDAMGSLAYVSSVTGDGVDNTDPLNPVINLAAVALSGDYADLINTPTNLSDFTNDVGYVIKNIYISDDSLTGNRTVSNAGFTLNFDGKTQVISPSVSALVTAFSVRNFGNTADNLLVDGAGNVRVGSIGNTGAKFGVKGIDNSASTYNTLLTNLAGDFLFDLDNDGQLVINKGNLSIFMFSTDNYFSTISGSTWHRGNGVGYCNWNPTGGVNFESTFFGGNQARAIAKVQIEPPTTQLHLLMKPVSAAVASALSPVAADNCGFITVNTTDATFTSTGLWRWDGLGLAWVFIG